MIQRRCLLPIRLWWIQSTSSAMLIGRAFETRLSTGLFGAINSISEDSENRRVYL
jgi:hypothetical protein